MPGGDDAAATWGPGRWAPRRAPPPRPGRRPAQPRPEPRPEGAGPLSVGAAGPSVVRPGQWGVGSTAGGPGPQASRSRHPPGQPGPRPPWSCTAWDSGTHTGCPALRPRCPAGRPATTPTTSMPAPCPEPCLCRARPPHAAPGPACGQRDGRPGPTAKARTRFPFSGAGGGPHSDTSVRGPCGAPVWARTVQTVNRASRSPRTGTRRPIPSASRRSGMALVGKASARGKGKDGSRRVTEAALRAVRGSLSRKRLPHRTAACRKQGAGGSRACGGGGRGGPDAREFRGKRR